MCQFVLLNCIASTATKQHFTMRNLYIGNLPLTVDREALTTLFLEKNIRFIKIKVVRRPGMIRGHAFIKCKDQKSADEAMDELDGLVFHGEQLMVEPQLPQN